ncbi:type II secretion system minor pseudopilin GspI [Legionella sp. W05-934-2]|jgi:general secretion pathway protein I|uniref:type II secretion system minor pseudopilin GspI n=1 Tax=Legionella sp. W05-934-2 TaxID=1198649 RepID=UPI0034623263
MPNPKGFTLIEVLLGLAILSIALTALLVTTGQDIQQTQRLKETMVSHWVAEQAMNEIRLGLFTPTNRTFTTYKTRWLNKDWFWQVQLKKTDSSRIKSITILTSTKRSGPFRPSLTGYWMLS